jgi:phenylacetate-coenzyme A ligase PaaK-like adenylate-forming protein
MLGLKKQDMLQIASQAWEYLPTSLSYPFSMFVGNSADRLLDFKFIYQLDLGPEASRTYATARYFKPKKALFTTTHVDSLGLTSMAEKWSVKDIGYEHIIFRGYTTALTGQQKKKYHEDWGVKINNMLDISDNLFFAADCEEYNGLHTWEDLFVVEAVDPKTKESVGPGESGKLVISNLFAEAVPIIRYLTNIDVTLDEDECTCGRTHVRIFTPNYK